MLLILFFVSTALMVNSEELVLVQTVFRHGDRAPIGESTSLEAKAYYYRGREHLTNLTKSLDIRTPELYDFLPTKMHVGFQKEERLGQHNRLSSHYMEVDERDYRRDSSNLVRSRATLKMGRKLMLPTPMAIRLLRRKVPNDNRRRITYQAEE
ncbi:hypothetical protein DICVIV_04535 [Dictyocaulus viviparus]|uniref:Histidine acid phosphatase n=1 Tax=Dictyocaulus viviparus TaxID=29172 RepID=A0A0D8XZN3_DICVI|nr:hypothetical protein DICVIV_04535 [Dictyocaulus viviparus]